jgi:murein DD-endopeptidase MepM/ murein hydrolase activator NlpD
LLAIGALAAVAATPAVAAETQTAEPFDAPRVIERGSPGTLAVRHADAIRERLAARAERRNPGPFVPVTGKVDYGTAENAFGASRSGHVHSGHDMFAPSGTPLVAATDAVVADAGSDGGQGHYIHLYDAEEDRTFVYMHMVAPAKHTPGEKVEAGEQLGGVGCTGSCWGDHLHFEIREGKGFTGTASDPLPELKQWETLSKPL